MLVHSPRFNRPLDGTAVHARKIVFRMTQAVIELEMENLPIASENLTLHIEAKDQILIPEIELSIQHHGVGPDFTVGAFSEFGDVGQGKTSLFTEALRSCFSKKDRPFGFIDAIEHSVGVVDSPFLNPFSKSLSRKTSL